MGVACTKALGDVLELIDNAVRDCFGVDDIPEEQEVRRLYEQHYDAYSGIPTYFCLKECNRDIEIDQLVRRFCTDLAIKKKLGFSYKDEDSKPWLGEAEDQIDWFYWDRYKKHLIRDKKWAPAAVKSIDRDSRNILDLMANPLDKNSFERRGLVVASVQSGKTANYIGLICRAADVGYRVIIVMAGVHNVLRNQTQTRLEEGFTGFNIANQTCEPVGVGKRGTSRRPVVCTSREVDFNTRRAESLMGIQTAQTKEPWLFVIKKNSTSLKQVLGWIKKNANQDDPLLLIDDEADNATINGKYKTEKRDDEPTKINGQIRQLLHYFGKACYVGYTATPFANVLIDPSVESDDYGKDLFPSNFIYTLEESSDYFGARKVFGDYDEVTRRHLRCIDDTDDILPAKHKSDFDPIELPASLKYAIRTFYLSTAIRVLRNGPDFHSTMMVNVSPYKKPQNRVCYLVDDYLEKLNNAAKALGSLEPNDALAASEYLADLRLTWEREYGECGFTWRDVQRSLYDSRYHVLSINCDSGDTLDYEHQYERVIAVGGYRLSRGLTLEGLSVSYYSRNAKAYDALMQMARWFGYRPGYEDLCRVWMTDQAAGWYKFVADATENLFDQLRSMRQVQRTPKNYVLKIRQSPDALTVTARNKMGAGLIESKPLNLNEGFVETVAFDRSRNVIDGNKQAMETLLASIKDNYDRGDGQFKHLFHNVPVEAIIAFLDAYENDDGMSPKSMKKPILEYIEDRWQTDGELTLWDVLVAHGSKGNPAVDLPVVGVVEFEQRYPGSKTSSDVLVVGEKHRLSSRGVEAAGLNDAEIKAAEAEYASDHVSSGTSNCSDLYYRQKRKIPLLVLHPVIVKFNESQVNTMAENGKKLPAFWSSWNAAECAYGWSVSFPHTDKQTMPVTYVLNAAAVESMTPETEDSDDDYEDE